MAPATGLIVEGLVTTLGLIGIELLVVTFGLIVFIAISCVELV